MPGRPRPRTGRPSSSSPDCSWSGWSPTRTACSPPAATFWPAVANGLVLPRHRGARLRGDHAAEPRHLGHIPHTGGGLRGPAPRRGRGTPALRVPAAGERGSLLLPGSNLTNVIVLGHLHLSGREFFAHMALAGVRAAGVTALVVAARLPPRAAHHDRTRRWANGAPVLGVGLVAVAAVTVLVLVLRSPALPVAAVGLVATVLRARRRGHFAERRPRASSACRCWSGCSAWPWRWDARPQLVRPRHPARPPRRLGDRGAGGRPVRARQQLAGGVAPGGAPAPAPLHAARRAQRGTEPVRRRVAGLGAVAARRPHRRGAARRRPSEPARARQRPVGHGARRRCSC